MGSLDDRLRRLEERRSSGEQWETPIEALVLAKAVERHQARKSGEEPPAYTREELEALYEEDLAEAAGGGTVAYFRNSDGWRSEKAQEILDEWEADARRNLEMIEAGASKEDVYGEFDEEEEEV